MKACIFFTALVWAGAAAQRKAGDLTTFFDAGQCVASAPDGDISAFVCLDASEATPGNNYCFANDIFVDDGADMLHVIAGGCPDHKWGFKNKSKTFADGPNYLPFDCGSSCGCGGCGSCGCGSCGCGSCGCGSCGCSSDSCGCGSECGCASDSCGCASESCGCASESCGCASESCGCASESCGCASDSCGCASESCGCASDSCGCASESCGCASESCGCASESCGCASESCGCASESCGCASESCGCASDSCGCASESCGCASDSCGCASESCGCASESCGCASESCGCASESCGSASESCGCASESCGCASESCGCASKCASESCGCASESCGCASESCGCGGCGSCGCGSCGCGSASPKAPKFWPVVQAREFVLPKAPVVGMAVMMLGEHDVVGVTVSGVELTGGNFSSKGNQFDSCHGHVYLATSTYHYHHEPVCLIGAMMNATGVAGEAVIVGWAMDGFPIYSAYDEAGAAMSSGSLDECNGLMVDGAYRYYVTKDAPFLPGCLRGSVVGTISSEATSAVCPRQGRNVTYTRGGGDDDAAPAAAAAHVCPLEVEFTAYLVDLFSWNRADHVTLGGVDLRLAPRNHSVTACVTAAETAEECAAAGFGLVGRLEDGTFDLRYVLDAAGAAEALALARGAAPTRRGLLVTASGEVSEGTQTLVGAAFDIPDGPVTATGVLVDMQCWWRVEGGVEHLAFDGVQLDEAADDHAVWCLRDVSACRRNGYGIMQQEASGAWDVAFSLSEEANAMALAVIDATKKEDQFYVEVVGERTSDEARIGTINARNLAFDVVDIVSIKVVGETVTHEGHLVDVLCWDLPKDGGADLDIELCRQSGFGLLRKTVAGTYDLAYRLDAAGNALALALLNATATEDDVFVKVTGTLGATAAGLALFDPTVFEPTIDPGEVVTAAPSPAVASCSSDDPAFECSLVLDSAIKFYWTVDYGPSRRGRRLDDAAAAFYPALRASLTTTTRDWVGLGFSANGYMVDSEAVITERSADAPLKYNLGGTDRGDVKPMGDASQTLRDASVEVVDGVLTARFTKSLSEPGEMQIDPTGTSWGFFIYASGNGGLNTHADSARGAVAIDLTSGDSSEKRLKPVNSNAIKVHAIVLIAAWAFCAPLATVVARTKHLWPVGSMGWLYIHILLQIATLALTVAGIAKAYVAIKRADGVDHFEGRHPKYGLAVGVLLLLQFLMGAARPHPKDQNGDKSAGRWAFEIGHRIVGYGTIVLATITMLGGVRRAVDDFNHISKMAPWNTAIITPLAISAALIFIATIFIFVKGEQPAESAYEGKGPSRDDGNDEKGDDEKGGGRLVVDEAI